VIASYEHSSLLGLIVSDEEKQLITLTPGRWRCRRGCERWRDRCRCAENLFLRIKTVQSNPVPYRSITPTIPLSITMYSEKERKREREKERKREREKERKREREKERKRERENLNKNETIKNDNHCFLF
jgi:hypothetical protein